MYPPAFFALKRKSMIEKIQMEEVIKNADTIELIRANLPLAELGKNGLAGLSLINAFQSKYIALKRGESEIVGNISGLCVIKHAYSNSKAAIVYIDNFTKSITQIAGISYTEVPMEIIWEGERYDTILKIKSTYASEVTTVFTFAFQFVH